MKRALLTLMLLCLPMASLAQSVDLTPVQERRALDLSYQIRCPVCDAQPIAESDAGQSKDMRDYVRAAVFEGRTDEDILNSLSESYGDFIRLTPRKELRTLPLWLAPWVFILIGFLILIVRRRMSVKRAQS